MLSLDSRYVFINSEPEVKMPLPYHVKKVETLMCAVGFSDRMAVSSIP